MTDWDIKSPISREYLLRKTNLPETAKLRGVYDVKKEVMGIMESFRSGENVVIDTTELMPRDINDLKNAIKSASIDESRIIWYSQKYPIPYRIY
jgi:hypothetical protein